VCKDQVEEEGVGAEIAIDVIDWGMDEGDRQDISLLQGLLMTRCGGKSEERGAFVLEKVNSVG